MKNKIFMVAAVIFSGKAQAQQVSQANTTDSTRNMDEVVITANKYPQKQSSTGKVLTVITNEQLQKNAGRTLSQVLNEQAGIVINGAQSTLGTNQSVYVRGAGAAYTLILVDGVPANDASGISSEFDLNHFAIDQVERVEILKGSQSVLYGSDAMAGVINIITKKKCSKEKISFNGTAAAGSYGTFKGTAGISGQADRISYNLQYSHLQSKGFSAAQDVTGNNNFDKDGFDQNVLSLHIGVQAAKNWNIRVFSQAGKYSTDLDDASFTDDKNNTVKNKNLQVGVSSVNTFTKGNLTINANVNNTDRRLNDLRNVPEDPADYDPFNGVYKSKSFFAEAYTNLNLHQHIGLLAGADVRDQKANIETTYGKLGDDSLKATQVSGYASLFLKSLRNFNAEVGTRFTHHSKFGNAVTFSVNPSYLINQQLKVFANIATGFRAPSLYNLASEYGNQNLKPERSTSYEGGLQFNSHKNTVSIRGTYFYRIIKDVIIFKSLFVPPYAQYDNADKQTGNGFELEAVFRPAAQWNITANYAFVDGKVETTSGTTGKDTSFYNLYRKPKNVFNTTVGYQATKQLYVSVGGRWVDKRDDLYFNAATYETEKKTLKAYYNIDIYAAYQAAKAVRFFIDLRNITNQEYFDQYGYNNRRFNFMTGATFNF